MLGELTIATLNNFFDFLLAPIRYPNMIVVVVPIILMFLAIEYILMKNPEYKALPNFLYANDLIIIFAGINLLRAIGYPLMYDLTIPPTMIGYLIVLVGATLIVLDYLKVIPLFIGSSISTKLVINYGIYGAIAYIYSGMTFTASAFLSLVILFFVIVAVINLIKVARS
jgi:hypothetical protein